MYRYKLQTDIASLILWKMQSFSTYTVRTNVMKVKMLEEVIHCDLKGV